MFGSIASFAHAQDTLFMDDAGKTARTARVVSVDDKYFKIETKLGAGAVATVSVPRSDVSRIEFAPNPALEKLLVDATGDDLPRVAAEWLRWRGFVGVPKSPAGRIANVYADLLLRADRAGEALAILKEIEPEVWDEADRMTARQNRLRAMVATGDAAAAVGEAKELAEVSDDPTVLIEAKFILATAAHRALEKLIEDNPRWEEDVNVRPEHERLVNEALDLYLYAYLFYGSEEDAAARGLWGATEIYELTGDESNALESARDLIALYPDSRFAELASGISPKDSTPKPENEFHDDSQS